MELNKLKGKTIKEITEPEVLIFDKDYKYDDDNIVIEFTDGAILKLASWDYESYRSGIKREIINK